jgi:hypothetical protein
MASIDPKMSKQGTAGITKHIILTILDKLEIIRRLESCESRKDVTASYNIESSSIYDIKKLQLTNSMEQSPS